MSGAPGGNCPKKLDDVSHLFFSKMDGQRTEEGVPPMAPPLPAKITPTPSPWNARIFSPEMIKRKLTARGSRFPGVARIVDEDAFEAIDADLLLVDDEGCPIFLEILRDRPEMIPYRILRREAWLQERKCLFTRAYGPEGVRNLEGAYLFFLAPCFPVSVIQAVAAMNRERIRLLRMEKARVDGEAGLLLREIFPHADGMGRCAFYPDFPGEEESSGTV